MTRIAIDEAELASRRAFFEISDEDLARLRALRPLAEAHCGEVVDALYELFLGHPESRRFFPDAAAVNRVKKLQRTYFLGLFAGVIDARYVDDRLRVGLAHERIGLSAKWYIGAYSRYLCLLFERIFATLPRTDAEAAYASVVKLVTFDMALAVDTYIAASTDSVSRHMVAIRELSTPVIRVHDRVLLLPLIGAIDSLRAEQIMETTLLQVSEQHARVLLIDIAGVAVVDTRVAGHLLATTEAVRLLGADTILTGISAQVARTMVQLGVEVSTMHTRTRLSDGIELALERVGRAITETNGQ